MFSILCLHWAPTWCRQRVPICATGGDLGFHLHHMLSIWAWGPRSPLGGPGPKLGPTRVNFEEPMRHAENLHFYPNFQGFLALMRVVAHIWACLGPKFRPTCVRTCPGCAMLGLTWFRRQSRPSWAQVGSCSAQLKAPVAFWPISCLSNSLGAGDSRREATRILKAYELIWCENFLCAAGQPASFKAKTIRSCVSSVGQQGAGGANMFM
jgi:hypothetical protein